VGYHHYEKRISPEKKNEYYPQPPVVPEAVAEDNTVLHSAGAVSKLLQIACLNASGVRAPEYFIPLIISVGEE